MIYHRYAWLIPLFAIFISGCSSKEAQVPPDLETVSIKELRDKQKSTALQHFIDGSILESKGEYASAIIEYQDALTYDKDAAIYFALAKNYAQLGKHALAASSAREAIALEPGNITYREMLAEVYIKSYQFDLALAQYRAILEIDSTHLGSMFNIARLLQSQRPLQALEMYERILQRTGQEWEVYHNIAMINESLRRYDKAAEAMEQMLKINPGAGQLRQSLADMYLRANQVDKAMTIISDLLERDSSNAELRSMLAGIFLQRDQWDKAREQFEIVLKDDSLSADTRFKIGFAFFLQIQKDSTLLPITRKQFEKFQKQYPGDWRPLFYLGMMSMLTKHDTAAINYFERVTALAAWNADAWAYLGSLYFDRGNYQQLIATMDRARQNVPNDARVYLLLGLAYTRLSRNDDAIAALERSIEIDPKDLNALSALGLAYDNVKRYKDCDRIYDSALTIDAHNALVLNNYAYSLSERGEQLERAMTMSRESLQKDSLNSSFLDTYGWILYKLERFDEALIYIQRSISAGEANAVVFEHLGDVYDKLKMPEKAREYWKKGLEMDSSNLSLKAKLEREIP